VWFGKQIFVTDATELTTASDTVAKIPMLVFIMFPCAWTAYTAAFCFGLGPIPTSISHSWTVGADHIWMVFLQVVKAGAKLQPLCKFLSPLAKFLGRRPAIL